VANSASARILVIDDDKDDLRLIQDFLSDAKRTRFVVDTAGDGETAKAQIKHNRYDVLLLDYRLPDLTGMALMGWLKDNHFRIPVVLITSHGDRRLQSEAMEAGFADYLEKGTFQADLLERTCFYAIGLNDHQVRDSSGAAGVGILIQELVSLTRESVTAQTTTSKETAELRKGLKEDVGGLHKELNSMREEALRNQTALLKVVQKSYWDKFREVLTWVTQHPVAALVMVLILTGSIVLLVLLLQVLDVDKVKALKAGVEVSTVGLMMLG
jgi:CheY-like chemotaxis protein